VIFKRLITEYPEQDIKRIKCVKICGDCPNSLFALVDGILLRVRNGEEQYLKVLELLETE